MRKYEIDQYGTTKEVEYKGEWYVVRDNGAVYRKRCPARRKSRLDEMWAFGRPVGPKGYLHIGNHQVHRIVAS